jgi:hypothetical protein
MVESVQLATLYHLRTFITIYATEEPFMHLTVICRSLICCVGGGGGGEEAVFKVII